MKVSGLGTRMCDICDAVDRYTETITERQQADPHSDGVLLVRCGRQAPGDAGPPVPLACCRRCWQIYQDGISRIFASWAARMALPA
jgi:hypothetical protein